jgi:chromosome segregation ATPase
MSAFYRVQNQRDALEDRVDELELECRLLTAQHDRRRDERDALEGKVEKLERELRMMRKQYDHRVEERDELLAGMRSLQHLFSQRYSARYMVELAQECLELTVAKYRWKA